MSCSNLNLFCSNFPLIFLLQIAVNVDGKSSKRLTIDETEKEIKYPSGMMDKQVNPSGL